MECHFLGFSEEIGFFVTALEEEVFSPFNFEFERRRRRRRFY